MDNEVEINRLYDVGVELTSEGTNFNIWAPKRKKIDVVLFKSSSNNGSKNELIPLTKDKNGYFTATLKELKAGSLYKFRLDENDNYYYPDPLSKFQPEGPHGPSMVVDHSTFKWDDNAWKGVTDNKIMYELHLGTFTKEGTWQAAAKQLKELKDLGITIIEIMPIAEFPGTRGWGYDGVNLFAPYHHYGSVDDVKYFINEAHKLDIAVILDVVYNHLGPDGNYIKEFTDYFFTDKHKTDWGEAINYDSSHSKDVRKIFIANAGYWIETFHFDGLRLDATQDIHDDSKPHIIKEIALEVVKRAKGRKTFVVAENEPQEAALVRHTEDGFNLDAVWNDDFHHSAIVAMTGRTEAYYTDYRGTPQEFISALKYGWLFQGQVYKWQKKRRGTPSFDLKHDNFVNYIENHDQIANYGRGLRSHQLTSFPKYKAMATLMILAPGIPMLFQGQEFATSKPFFFFVDHDKNLNKLIQAGRKEFMAQFRSIGTPEMQASLPDPIAEDAMEKCTLDFEERKTNGHIYQMYKDLLKIKSEDKVVCSVNKSTRKFDGAVLANDCFVTRFFSDDYNEDRLLIINLDGDLYLHPAPEPLLAPPLDKRWELLFSTEDPKYLGHGTAALDNDKENWIIPSYSAILLKPVQNKESHG